ncbi:MAG TPA: dihydrofolate reductase [Pseudomonadales bacterium]
MKVSLIWAMARNGVIGRGGGLPWRLPREMKHFMTTTRDHPVIMGRRTFESMDGKPLPRRHNIVVSRNRDYRAEGVVVVGDLAAALAEAEATGADEAFVIGGAELYRSALERADRLYVTVIDAELEGDTVFPELDWSGWREVARVPHPADDENPYPFTIFRYERA